MGLVRWKLGFLDLLLSKNGSGHLNFTGAATFQFSGHDAPPVTHLDWSNLIMSSKIRCVAFDAVGTLIYPEPSVSRVYWKIGQKYGSRLDHEQVRSGFHNVFQDLAAGARGDFSTNETEEEERWKEIVRRVLSDVTEIDDCFQELHEYFGLATAWRSFPDVMECLDAIHHQGRTLLVASNFDQRLNPICDELSELKRLQYRVISATVGWHKPSERFYEQVVRTARCEPDQILMVGDDFKNDVAAARAYGLQAVLIDRSKPKSSDSINDLRQILELLA